jgi:Ca2+-binding RTX toxin-like protein
MLCAAAVLACGLAPATADAATLANNGTLTYTGLPGEQNTIEFESHPGGVLYVGPMRGSVSGCESTSSPTLVRCLGVGSIVADLGDGDDVAFAMEPYPAALSGGPGDDMLGLLDPGVGSVLSGGPGLDTAVLATRRNSAISVSLDDVSNDGVASVPVHVGSDIENVSASSSAPVTVTGSAGANDLTGGAGDDSIIGGAGSDALFGNDGQDTLDARDGETDRVECGPGRDTALVDPFDHVGDSCEVVQVAQIGRVVHDDAAPRVAFEPGDELEVAASDDRGVVSVRFQAGDRTLCTDTTAPFSCSFQPRVEDVGRMTIVAVATDTAGQTATALRTAKVPKFEPRSVSLSVKRRGRGVVATGKVTLPAGVPCSGEVAIKRGRATKTAKLSRACTYRIVMPSGGTFYAAYRGTKAIEPKRSAWRGAR